MGFPINPPNAAMVDPRTGLVTSEWYIFFLKIQELLGGPSDPFDDTALLTNPPRNVSAAPHDELSSPILPTSFNISADDPLVPYGAQRIAALDSDKQPLDATLTALAAFNTNGFLVQTAADTFVGRTLAAPAAGLSITNPAGTAGNPTFALANDLAALEGLGSTGLPVRTAADTWTQRSIAAGAGISVANGDGVSGNPTITCTITQYTDEAAQDAAGAMVDSTLVYVDATPLLTRAALTGDATAAQGSNALTLATVNSNVGSFGSATQVGTFTVNGKGLVTAAANVTITPAVGSITGLGTSVATALGVNIGSAGAFVTFNGAGGTPSSLTLTNATGLLTAGLANDAVTYAKIQNASAASRLLGRGSAAGSGDFEELTAGLGLEISSTVLRRATGTSFPGSPATGDLFWRSDRLIEYVYDGTRWLSTQVFVHQLTNSDALDQKSASGSMRASNPWWNVYSVYVEDFTVASFNTTATDVNYFTVALRSVNSTSFATLGTISGQNNTQNAWIGQAVAVDAVVGSAIDAFDAIYTETATASAYITASFTYRLVG